MSKRWILIFCLIFLAAKAEDIVVSTAAGTASSAGATDARGLSAKFNGSLALELDNSSGDLIVADTQNRTIRRVARNGEVRTLAGTNGEIGTTNASGSAARFNYPQAATIDKLGNIYIAESNHSIRKITPDGAVSLYAGAADVSGFIDGNTTGSPEFGTATQAAVNAAGDIYVADTSNHTIRRVTAAGVVSTFAGTAGASGTTNNTGAAARFNAPTGIVVLSNGSMLVADNGNNLIRKITTGGLVSTFAGNGDAESVDATGTAASFNKPFGLARDSADNVYVAEKGSHIVRKITPARVVTTIAGSAGVSGNAEGAAISVARFNSPTGVVLDTANNIYIADEANHRIRKIVAGGTISTFAGTAGVSGTTNANGTLAKFNNPRGLVVSSNGSVFVADCANNRIRKITPAGLVSTLAGSGVAGAADGLGTAASFRCDDTNLAIDADDNLYLPDTNNHTVRKITQSGLVTTIAGTALSIGSSDSSAGAAASRFNQPTDMVTDSQANIFVADHRNHVIRKITAAGAVSIFAGAAGLVGGTDGTGSAARFNGPAHITVDDEDNLYVSDYWGAIIRKISPAAEVSTIAGAYGVAGSADSNIAANARFNWPVGMAVDTDHNVYVADYANRTIRKITEAGVVSTIAGFAGSIASTDGIGSNARFNSPHGLFLNGSTLYVTDRHSHVIRSIDLASNRVTTILGGIGLSGSTDASSEGALAARFSNFESVARDGDGNIFFADYLNHTIRKLTLSSSELITFAGSAGLSGNTDGTGSAARFNKPTGITVLSNGAIMVADNGNNLIRKITSGALVTTFAGNGDAESVNATGTAASFNKPYGIAGDSSNNIYVAEKGAHLIRKITPAGLVSTLAGTVGLSGSADGAGSLASFNQPTGVSVDGSDDLYVADYGNHMLRKVTAGGVVTSIAGAAGLAGTADGGPIAVKYNRPYGMDTDSSGNLYVADSANHTIRKITTDAIVTTLAGAAGSAGFINAAGSAARFYEPVDVAVGNLDNLYVADKTNNCIRKITPSGTVSTFAGTCGSAGYADGTGAAARFNSPSAIEADATNNLYVSDTNNHTVRKITTAGVVTTIAGAATLSGSDDSGAGGAVPARFNYPTGLYRESNGKLLVADNINHTIRVISPTGVVTTLAGTAGENGSTNDTGSAARFDEPQAVAKSSNGSVFVTDYKNHTIRKITPAGVVTTLAGSAGLSGTTDNTGSAARFNRPVGIYIDADDYIYVTDHYNHCIRKITQSGVVTTVAGLCGINNYGSADGTSAARFRNPFHISGDSDGNLYVTDETNHTIRKITTGGVVSTIAGLAANPGYIDGGIIMGKFNSPAGVVTDTSGNIYVADTANKVIRKITPSGTVSVFAGVVNSAGTNDGTGSGAKFTSPNDIVLNGSNLYVADQHCIRRISVAGAVVTTLAGSCASGGYDIGSAKFNGPISVLLSNSGNIYVSDHYNNTIRKIAPNGIVTTFVGLAGYAGTADGTGSAARFRGPDDLAEDSLGNIYVTDHFNGTIRKITPAGVVTTFASGFDHPEGLVIDSSNNLFVSDHWHYTICKITPQGVVSVFAGAYGQVGSADGTGSAARFNAATNLAIDVSNNLYVTDYYNHTIRKITPSAVVTTLAGSAGQAGSTDATGSSARFYLPYGVAVDGSGNVYVSEYGNHTIRKISSGAVVTTLAGNSGYSGYVDGTGSAARFNYPFDISIDGSGDIYVADFYNQIIRKVSSGGAVTTFAGTAGQTGSADSSGTSTRFNNINSLTTDTSGNLYAADTGNHLIRKIVISSGAVTTHAGVANSFGSNDGAALSGLAKFNLPTSIVTDSGGNMFVAENGNHIIRKITPAGAVSVFAGAVGQAGNVNANAGSARFNGPSHLAIDSSDNLYVSDDNNHSIRKIEPDADVTTLAGTGSAGAADGTGTGASFNRPCGVWASTNGNLFVTDHANHCIRKIVRATGVVTTFAGSCGSIGSTDATGTAAKFYYPYELAGDNAGNLYVADEYNHTIRKITSGGVVTTLAGKAGTIGSSDGSNAGGRFSQTRGIAVDSNKNLYLADNFNHCVRKITPDGTVSTFVGLCGTSGNATGTGTAARFNYIAEIEIDGSDNLYIADHFNNIVRKSDSAGVVTTFATGISRPHGVAIDGSGNLYVSELESHHIKKITALGAVSNFAGSSGNSGTTNGSGSSARFNRPHGIAYYNSTLYVADGDNHCIRAMTLAADVSTFAGTCGTSGNTNSPAKFYEPVAITIDGSGNLYVADTFNSTIRKITQGQVVTTVVGSAGTHGYQNGTGSAAYFNKPHGLVYNGTDLYVADTYNYVVRKVSLPGAVVTTFAGQAGEWGNENTGASSARFKYPNGLSIDASNNIYVSELLNHTIRKITSAGTVTTLAGSAPTSGSADGTGAAAKFNGPTGAFVNGSSLYVADTQNHTIRKVTLSAGLVTTVAGIAGQSGSADGSASRAKFKSPSGIAYSANGSLFVADTGNYTIRKINSSGVVTTLAGLAANPGAVNNTGSVARFGTALNKLRTDSSNNVYAADSSNHAIRAISPAGVVTTLAGSLGSYGSADGTGAGAYFYNPVGLHMNGTNLYITDQNNHTIRKSTSGGVVTTVSGIAGQPGSDNTGASSARFNQPTGITVDSNKNVYVSEWSNNTIRKITPSSTVSTLAGNNLTAGYLDGSGASARFNRPLGLAVDSSANVYVADTYNHSLRKVTATGVVTTIAGTPTLSGSNDGDDVGARFYYPMGLTFSSNGSLFVADRSNHTIRKINTSGDVTTFAGAALTPGYTNSSTGSNARFNYPSMLAIDGSDNIYVSDYNNHTIRMITQNTAVSIFAGRVGQTGSDNDVGIAAKFYNPAGVHVSAGGDLYVSEYGNHTIRKVTLPGASVSLFSGVATTSGSADSGASSARFNNPAAVAINSSTGDIYVSDQGNHSIRKINSNSVVSTLTGVAQNAGSSDGAVGVAKFNRPSGLALDATNAFLYVADKNNATLRKVTISSGAVTTVAGAAAQTGWRDSLYANSAARFNEPEAVTMDAAGNLYVADMASHTIRKITRAGEVSTFSGVAASSGSADGISSARFYSPTGITANGTKLYVADRNNHTIRSILRATAEVSTLAGLAGSAGSSSGSAGALFKYPRAITVDSDNNIYIADTGNYTIRKIAADTGRVSTYAGTAGSSGTTDGTGAAALFDSPWALAVDSSDNIFVAEKNKHTIRKIESGAVVSTFAGTVGVAGTSDGLSTSASFTSPTGLAIDSLDNLFVVGGDGTMNSSALRKISPQAIVSTVTAFSSTAGTTDGALGSAQTRIPFAIALNSSEHIFISDTISHTIRKMIPAGYDVSTFAGSVSGSKNDTGTDAKFKNPSALAIDSSNNIYVADKGNHIIRKIDSSAVVTTVAGSSGSAGNKDASGLNAKFKSPAGIAVSGSNIYVVDTANYSIRKIVSSVVTTLAGAVGVSGSADGSGVAARFNNPAGLAVDTAGNLYVSDKGNHSIRRISTTGVVTTIAGTGSGANVNATGTAASFNSPSGITIDSAGNIYVADTTNHQIRKIAALDAAVTTIAGSTSGFLNDNTGTSARFNSPTDVAIDQNNNIYVADSLNHVIRKIKPNTSVSTLAGGANLTGTANGIGTAARFNTPKSLSVNAEGTLLYVADSLNQLIRKIRIINNAGLPATGKQIKMAR